MTLVSRRVLQDISLTLTAFFAIFWAILRASVQSITLDESDNYFWFVARPVSYIWYPFSNNHVLNTLLMWMTTHAPGTSIMTIRAPALLGATLYIFICYFLCRNITNQFNLQLPLLICLIYNPFIFDFMVAARGYSPADAFLLAAIAVPIWHRVKGAPSLPASCVAAFLGILAWALRRREGESARRIVEHCTLPGLFVVMAICAYPLAHWKREDLRWGAHSFSEMTQSLVQSLTLSTGPPAGRQPHE